jgi:hypothetical protein
MLFCQQILLHINIIIIEQIKTIHLVSFVIYLTSKNALLSRPITMYTKTLAHF